MLGTIMYAIDENIDDFRRGFQKYLLQSSKQTVEKGQ